MNVILCYGVQPDYTCHYEGACFGEICINPSMCKKKAEELTQEEKDHLKKFLHEMKYGPSEDVSEP